MRRAMQNTPLIHELAQLVSENRNPRTTGIDLLETPDLIATICGEDRMAFEAVSAVQPAIAAAVEVIVESFRAGGRLIYIGAGTSGRLGVLDASECPPTFSVPGTMVVGLIAGGDYALRHAVEGAEDSETAGGDDLVAIGLDARDVVVGIAVSGRTPYVIGALKYARACGAKTVALSCNPQSAIANIAEIAISPIVGPEVVTGSTRLKSGTAQKLVLNMLSTASMIRIGKTYSNFMVDLSASNEKLVARAIGMISDLSGCTPDDARRVLAESGNEVKLAILMAMTGLSADEGRKRLGAANGFLRQALPAKAAFPATGV